MTIFDTIRYPISTPPTEQELAALPAELFDNWKLNLSRVRYTPRNISYWYSIRLTDNCLKEINLLRQMIKDYDNI